MQNLTWKGSRLRVQSYNVMVGTQQLELRRCYRDAGAPPILMLPGFLEDAAIFFPPVTAGVSSDVGLAPYLASQGFDVYVAELRGKGKGWPAINGNSKWGLHEAITEDIPAHLTMLQRLRPGAAQVWLGHGLGGLLLAAAYARGFAAETEVLGMVHIAAARRCSLDTRAKRMAYRYWSAATAVSKALTGYITKPFSKSAPSETTASLKQWQHWHCSSRWLDEADGFDYGAALQSMSLPPAFYLANHQHSLWGSAPDCRAWIEELGAHDARLMIISKAGGNARDYSDRDLLQHPSSCDDHFLQLSAWLKEISQFPAEVDT